MADTKKIDHIAINAAIKAAMPNAIAQSPSAPDTATNNVYQLALRTSKKEGTRWILNLYHDTIAQYMAALETIPVRHYTIYIRYGKKEATLGNTNRHP
jgi:hypothetical protein